LKTVTRLAVLRLLRLAFALACEPWRTFRDPVRFAARLARSLLRINILPPLGQLFWQTALIGSAPARNPNEPQHRAVVHTYLILLQFWWAHKHPEITSADYAAVFLSMISNA
jgi:hypothetical protein